MPNVGLAIGVAVLRRSLGGIELGQTVAAHGQILAAAAPAGLVAVAVRRWGTDTAAPGLSGQMAVLLLAGVVFVLVFGLLARRTAASQVRLLVGTFSSLRRPSPEP